VGPRDEPGRIGPKAEAVLFAGGGVLLEESVLQFRRHLAPVHDVDAHAALGQRIQGHMDRFPVGGGVQGVAHEVAEHGVAEQFLAPERDIFLAAGEHAQFNAAHGGRLRETGQDLARHGGQVHVFGFEFVTVPLHAEKGGGKVDHGHEGVSGVFDASEHVPLGLFKVVVHEQELRQGDDRGQGRLEVVAHDPLHVLLEAGCLAQGEVVCDPRPDHPRVEGLGDEIDGPQRKARGFGGDVVEGGDEDDRDVGGPLVGLQPAADLEAVHAGHHDVEQDDVRRRESCDFQRPLAACGRDDIVFAAEEFDQDVDIHLRVIHHQNL